jgi:hypothetical protein
LLGLVADQMRKRRLGGGRDLGRPSRKRLSGIRGWWRWRGLESHSEWEAASSNWSTATTIVTRLIVPYDAVDEAHATIDWNARCTAIFKRELEQRGVTYINLAGRLGTNREAVTTKIGRGVFLTRWFLEALDALGVEMLRLSGF